MDATVLLCDEGYALGQLANLGIIFWRKPPTVPKVLAIRECFPRLEVTPGQGFGLLSIVEPDCPPPQEGPRKEFDRGIREARDAMLGIDVVIEATGLLAAVTRAFVRAMTIVHRTPFPFRILGSVTEAAEGLPNILSARGARPITPAQIIAAVAHVRGHIGTEVRPTG